MIRRIAIVQINSKYFNNNANLTWKLKKQEMYYLNYHNALWDLF